MKIFYGSNGSSWTNTTGWLESGNHCEWAGVICDKTMLGAQILGVIVGNTLGADNCGLLENEAESTSCQWFKNPKNHPLSANAETFDYLKVRIYKYI